jgi:hypothetical protein
MFLAVLQKKNLISQDNHLSGGGSCSGGQSARLRIESDGSSHYIDADNQVSEEMHLISVEQNKKKTVPKIKITKTSCLFMQQPTSSETTLDDDPWGKNLFANMSFDEVKDKTYK